MRFLLYLLLFAVYCNCEHEIQDVAPVFPDESSNFARLPYKKCSKCGAFFDKSDREIKKEQEGVEYNDDGPVDESHWELERIPAFTPGFLVNDETGERTIIDTMTCSPIDTKSTCIFTDDVFVLKKKLYKNYGDNDKKKRGFLMPKPGIYRVCEYKGGKRFYSYRKASSLDNCYENSLEIMLKDVAMNKKKLAEESKSHNDSLLSNDLTKQDENTLHSSYYPPR